MKRPDPQTVWRTTETATVALAALLIVLVLWVLVSRTLGEPGDDDANPPASPIVGPASEEGSSRRESTRSPRLAAALETVRQRNIFNPPAPKGFQGQLTGILGNQAVFNGNQRAGVGDNVMGAKVLAIGPDWVEIEFEGQKREMRIFGDGFRGGGGDRRGGSRRRPGRGGDR